MIDMGRVVAVCISEKKGTPKKDIGRCRLIEEYGLEGDAHAGSERQVSLLSYEEVEAFRERADRMLKTASNQDGQADVGDAIELPPGIFGENLLVEGIDFKTYPIGTKFRCGEVLLELMQIGKRCHSGCTIMQRTGECIMPREGVFARVIAGGTICNGDEMVLVKQFRAAILVASDRSFRGEREDKSGPKMKEILQAAGYRVGTPVILPDDEDGLTEELIRMADAEAPDVIFTTGGTGFSPRDRMPEATKRMIERETPGISEAIRAYSMTKTNRAMLSRATSGIRGGTLIVNLPGSPKAVEECLEFLLPPLAHGLEILRGEGDA